MHAAELRGDGDRAWVRELGVAAGLCSSCRHAEPARSRRSTFLRCRLADSDPAFRRYPALPVVRCAGYSPLAGEEG